MTNCSRSIAITAIKANGIVRVSDVPDAANNFFSPLAFHHRDIVLALQVEPKLRAVAKIAAEADRRVGGDRTAAVPNVGDAAGRHADIKPVGRISEA